MPFHSMKMEVIQFYRKLLSNSRNSQSLMTYDTLPFHIFIIAPDFAMKQVTSNVQEKGFILYRAKNRRHPATKVIVIDFANDMAVLSYGPQQAQPLLHQVKGAAKCIIKNLQV